MRVLKLAMRSMLLAAVALIPMTPPAGPAAIESVAATEVRLRKLHLVRPDLIPYPIAYEVCC